MNTEKTLNIPGYSADELVRLEILAYPTPEGLHPIEKNWRDLCKKLLQHSKELQKGFVELNIAVSSYQRFNFKPMKFPEQFTPTNINE